MVDYKQEFISTFKREINREGADKLLESLEKSDFFTAPASTRFHDSEHGGLTKHSLNVYKTLLTLPNISCYNGSTLAIVALLHDICKIGTYEVSTRNVKKNNVWVQEPYYIKNDTFPYGHGEKSVYLIMQFMKLTDEEAMAIRFHMGAYIEADIQYLSKAYTEFPLALLTHTADNMASTMKGVL